MPTRFPVVPVSEVLVNQFEIEINGLAVNFRSHEPVQPESPNIAQPVKTVFEVRGLQPGYKAWIVGDARGFQLLREWGGTETQWLGEYPSVEAALRALSNQLAFDCA